MDAVTVSTKYQVVIPKAARRLLGIQPGQKMQVIIYDNRVILVPVHPMRKRAARLKAFKPMSRVRERIAYEYRRFVRLAGIFRGRKKR